MTLLISPHIFYVWKKKQVPDNEYITTHQEDLNKVNSSIDRRLATEWIALTGGNYSVQTVPYQARLEHNYRKIITDGKVGHEHIFRLRITDSLNEKQPSQFRLNQRSKGYQWFCNFVLKLFYNGEYTDTQSHAIFLLDEPGSYLHPLAQDRLLDKLIELSKSNNIIYTTHLPQLVNPTKIRLHDCLVVYRQSSDIILKKYGEMNDEQSYGALTTLNNAIKINIPGLLFPNMHLPFVITEGITEFYVYKMIQEQTALFSSFEVSN